MRQCMKMNGVRVSWRLASAAAEEVLPPAAAADSAVVAAAVAGSAAAAEARPAFGPVWWTGTHADSWSCQQNEP